MDGGFKKEANTELLKTCKTSKTKKLLTVDAEWSPNLLGSLTWVKKEKSL